MRCTRAALVQYRVAAPPVDADGDEVPEELAFPLAIEARVRRRLIARGSDAEAWPDVVAAPIFEAKTVVLREARHTIRPERQLWEEWARLRAEREELAAKWKTVVKQMTSTVPRPRLKELVEAHVPESERQMARFGQQVDSMLGLPGDAEALTRCQAVIEQLGRWTDAVALTDAAEHAYRLGTRIDETALIMREALKEDHAAAVREAEEAFRLDVAAGFCVPEERYALLDDTLFVFDGEYDAEEMRGAMIVYMADLRDRMTAAAEEADRTRDAALQERPSEIPARVRALVWRRDGGRCVVCRSTENLEFDHVIPLSAGGASTPRNVQVLCARCNEKKGAQVALLRENAAKLHQPYDGTRDLFDPGDGEEE